MQVRKGYIRGSGPRLSNTEIQYRAETVALRCGGKINSAGSFRRFKPLKAMCVRWVWTLKKLTSKVIGINRRLEMEQ